ncbi:MAG TPA: ATP-binding protein [Albitalea sp.]|nr:ATP-binding protein [Albitalea sp.]
MVPSLTLRAKGILAILILIGYLALIAGYLANKRNGLVAIVQEMEGKQSTLELVERSVNLLAHSLVEVQTVLNEQAGVEAHAISVDDQDLHLEALNLEMERVLTTFPAVSEHVVRFRLAAGALKAMPSVVHLSQVRDSEQVLLLTLQDALRTLQRQGAELSQEYHRTQQFISGFAVAANVVGAVASVAVILVFFTRLARDINRLRDRASAIVKGYDGEPLRNDRRDEVGGLIDDVNRMQVDLRRLEKQHHFTLQQRFYQEKMAAVGSLASAIAHEVSNPMAAIAGVTQFIADESADDDRPQGRQINGYAREILVQTERIMQIMRQMTTLATRRSLEPELLDLNELVRSTCGFIRYDKRFRAIDFEEALDPNLPAVTAVSDHITQILMNLLINAADAFDRSTDDARRCTIRIATRVQADEVLLSIADNGCGMTPEVLSRAFDESFTTKPAREGRGIGLFVCKSLIEEAGGRIELASVPGEGSTATVHIPLRALDDSRS